MSPFPVIVPTSSPSGETRFALGDPLVDSYLEFVAGRSRPNTLRAVAFDLKSFFAVIDKDPLAVVPADVFEFLADQRGDRTVVRMSDGESGLSARTIARRLSSVSGFYAYLVARGDTSVETNPVPKGLSTRRRGGRVRTVPLVRVPRTLPKILSPGDVDALVGALRTIGTGPWSSPWCSAGCDAAKCSDCDCRTSRWPSARCSSPRARAATSGWSPSPTLLRRAGEYLVNERPKDASTNRVFVTLKGLSRGQGLSAQGVETILLSARQRAGLERATCHQLRHTCLTRLREAGMALEAVQAQAGHVSIESTRIYLHLTNDWLANEYHQAMGAVDAHAAELLAMVEMAQ